MSMLMLLCGSVFAEEVTINFDNDYATLFPTLPGVSCSANKEAGVEASSDGDFTETTTSTAVSGVTVTVSAAEEGKTPNRIWNASPRLRMYSGTFTVTGTDITKIVFNAPKFAVTASTGTLNGKTWTGDKTNEIVFTVTGNTQMKNIVVTLGESGGEIVPPNPEPEVKTVTIAEFNDAEVSNDVWYQLTGIVKNLMDDDIYGNFDLEDETGSVYVYGLVAEKGGAKKQFQQLVAEKGIKEGSKLTLIGNRGVYNETVEVVNAYFVNVENEETPIIEPITESVIFNFDDDYAMLFPTLPGVSSSANQNTGEEASSDGDITEALTSTAVNGVTVTVSAGEEGKTPNRIWSGSPRLRMYSGNFTVTGKNIVKIEFAASDFNLSTETGTLEGKIWTGKADEVVFKVKKKTLVKKIVVTLAKDGNEIPGDMNRDGKLDIADVISVLNLVANDHYDKIADLNNDDAVTIADAMLLLEQVAGTK